MVHGGTVASSGRRRGIPVAQAVNHEEHGCHNFTPGLERAKGTTVGTDDGAIDISFPTAAPTRSLHDIGA